MTTKQCLNCSRHWPYINGHYQPFDKPWPVCPSCGAAVDYAGPMRGWLIIATVPLPVAQQPFDVKAWLAERLAKREADDVVLEEQIERMEANKKQKQ
jgi:hypothetical protein